VQFVSCGTTEQVLDFLVKNIPGYASDLFLKRAQLFIMQLHRKLGILDVDKLTVPADYHIPRILRSAGCISYSGSLVDKISNQEIIPKGSHYETCIRATAIIACDYIAEKLGITPMQVDDILWQKRREFTIYPFHLTVTTDY
jgi:hypothetical protein